MKNNETLRKINKYIETKGERIEDLLIKFKKLDINKIKNLNKQNFFNKNTLVLCASKSLNENEDGDIYVFIFILKTVYQDNLSIFIINGHNMELSNKYLHNIDELEWFFNIRDVYSMTNEDSKEIISNLYISMFNNKGEINLCAEN